MATIVLTAVGTMLGGPLGGALGSLVGNQIDRAVIGGPQREGPRLKELTATISSYGTPIPRHYGRMRAAGSVIWATDLVETSERSGGGKGRPSTTSYSYAANFAVALASRPITGMGRIWADGSLLRGAAGDLKVGGAMRLYRGFGDQMPDPLIASDKGSACPAFRGLAYCVFEGLHLGDFGNRIPALTFEIVADTGEVSLIDLLRPLGRPVLAGRRLEGLIGFSDEGGSIAENLRALDQAWPIACDASGPAVSLVAAEGRSDAPAVELPDAAGDASGDGFGAATGSRRERRPEAREIPDVLRYYDPGRDYQTGLQRADGRARAGRGRVIEVPGALGADDARGLINAAAERAGRARETLSWRIAELDPQIGPGTIVSVPGQGGSWLVESWEWGEHGVELALRLLPHGPARQQPGDTGAPLPAPDMQVTPTLLIGFELPWDGLGSSDIRAVFAAVSSERRGWTGAALFAGQADGLVPLGHSRSRRSVIGHALQPIGPSPSLRFEPAAEIEVTLVSADFTLASTSLEGLANGANRAMLGSEMLQYVQAQSLGERRWRLRGLLRGRGGTETAAMAGHGAGTPFVLLDDAPVALDAGRLGTGPQTAIAALGLADAEPVSAAILNSGATLRPLSPVHPQAELTGGGGLRLGWTRRARGSWAWQDGMEAPLSEQAEAYQVSLGDPDMPQLLWNTAQPQLEIAPAIHADLRAGHAGAPLWVRQVGTHDRSLPLLLTILG